MANRKSGYPPEFRAEAIQLARTSGKPQTVIARELGMSVETLRMWLKQADLDAGKRSDGLTSEEQEELRRLRRENRILREEREILKKPRPSSPRRASRPAEGLRVRGAREGQPSRQTPLPGAGCRAQRLLGVAQTWPLGACAGGRPLERADWRVVSGEPGNVWRTAPSGGIGGGGDAVRTQAGRAPDAAGRTGGLSPAPPVPDATHDGARSAGLRRPR
jgi:transposase